MNDDSGGSHVIDGSELEEGGEMVVVGG